MIQEFGKMVLSFAGMMLVLVVSMTAISEVVRIITVP